MYIRHRGLDLELFQREFEETHKAISETVRRNMKIANRREYRTPHQSKALKEFRAKFGHIPY